MKKELKERYPGCYVLKNDPSMIQGIPDLTILYKNKWASLEVKRSEEAYKESLNDNPKQNYHIQKMDEMSFASYIYPENKQEVLNALDKSFI